MLLIGLLRPRAVREVLVPLLALAGFLAAIGLGIWQYGEQKDLVAGALRLDDLTIVLSFVFCTGGAAAVLLSWRAVAPREAAHGEYFALLLTSAAGMWVLVAAQNLVTLFLGLELLSIPLYVLCATEMRRATSLESGLKYLIIGSVGSATLLYGLAFLYGATGSTDFAGIAKRRGRRTSDPLLLTGIALSVVGLAFKASVAPFHQWTPDVYEGAPTPVTAFMAVATKAAAFGAFLRLFDVALLDASADWAPALAVLATITIVVGNVGALGQSSLKRLMAWSSVAQAGYMLAGVVVATRLGVQATVFYLGVYLMMNLAAFAVIVIRERETGLGDDIASVQGLGAQRPLLAMAMTLAMLGLAGIPGDRRLHRQVLFDRRRRRRRLRVARRRHRHRLDDLARLLPEGRRGDVDGRGAGRRHRAADLRTARAGRRLSRGRHPADRGRDVVRGALLRRGDAVLRDRALAAVQPGRPRRALADPALLGRPSRCRDGDPPPAACATASPSVPPAAPLATRRDDARLVGEDHRLHAVADAELGEHVGDVGLDRAVADHEALRRSRRSTGRARAARAPRARGR